MIEAGAGLNSSYTDKNIVVGAEVTILKKYSVAR
jgi:hypothetical protein